LPILFVEKFSIDPFRELAYLPATLERRGGQTGGLAAETTGEIEQNGWWLIPHPERDGTFCGTLVVELAWKPAKQPVKPLDRVRPTAQGSAGKPSNRSRNTANS
jgi:hypothetical protein